MLRRRLSKFIANGVDCILLVVAMCEFEVDTVTKTFVELRQAFVSFVLRVSFRVVAGYTVYNYVT